MAFSPEYKETSWLRFRRRARNFLYSSRLFNQYLSAPSFEAFSHQCINLWPGDPERGNAIFQGIFEFAGHEVRKPNEAPWFLAQDNPSWMAELHCFGWLADVAAVEADAAKLLAQRMVLSWIDSCRQYDPTIWAPEVSARRILIWLRHGDYLLDGLEPRHRDKITGSLMGQYRFLQSCYPTVVPGQPRFLVALALLLGASTLPGEIRHQERASIRFLQELDTYGAFNGENADRAPASLFVLARDLVALNADLSRMNHPLAAQLTEPIEQIMMVLQILRHGDGNLAVFGESRAIRSDDIDHTIEKSGASYQPAGSASSSGFQRLAVDRAITLIDVGLPAPAMTKRALDPGMLSFEFSVGPNRVVVNGAHPVNSENFPSNSSFLVEGQGARDFKLNPGKKVRPDRIKCRRHEDEADSVWLETVHGGFQESFGVLHQRRYFLDGNGSNLRGEDVLLRANDKFQENRDCAALFYLHPDVQASRVQGGGSIMLRLATGGGWQFRADGGEIELSDSLYLADGGAGRRSQYILVRGKTALAGTKIRWVFHRL